MKKSREKIVEEQRRSKAEYGNLFDEITALLFRADPIGLDFGDNADEYEPEPRTILPRLKSCKSADDVLQVVHEEFVRWFEGETAGSRSRYRKIASEIWDLWQQRGREIKLGGL